jgi:sulfate adenylyltransferase large subunit
MFNIVIVGHVDHGKSTLIGRIVYDTGSLPKEKLEEIKRTCEALGKKLEFAYIVDALEEERKQEMTIDTTQTFFKTPRRSYCIIDAPGHKEFLKNMITGASQADAAILTVDVSEGVKEQTKRHAYLLKLLGIPQIIVAINKMDLVNYNENKFEEVKKDVINYLNKIGIEPSYIIPISAYKGDNVANKSKNTKWYKGLTVLEALDSLEIIFRDYNFRLPVQDVYEIKGEKIYVGNILAGSVRKNDIIKIFPEEKEVKVNKIITFEGELEEAKKPKAVGIVIDGEAKRGEVFCKGKNPLVVREIVANVFCITNTLEVGENYVFRCTTQEIPCELNKIEEIIDTTTLKKSKDNVLKESEIGKIKLNFSKPVVVERFKNLPELGRFVLEEDGRIIAGGIIL